MSMLTRVMNIDSGIRHAITVSRTPDADGGFTAEIDAHVPVMERPYDLRATFCSPDIATALYVASYTAMYQDDISE